MTLFRTVLVSSGLVLAFFSGAGGRERAREQCRSKKQSQARHTRDAPEPEMRRLCPHDW